MKRQLIKYETNGLGIHCFGDSHEFQYLLTIKETYKHFFFWERTRIKKVPFVISMFQSVKTHKDHWDELIKTGKHIN